MGTTLEIDLTEGIIEKRETDSELTHLYLGGKGVNARIFWERVPLDAEAFFPGEPADHRHLLADRNDGACGQQGGDYI